MKHRTKKHHSPREKSKGTEENPHLFKNENPGKRALATEKEKTSGTGSGTKSAAPAKTKKRGVPDSTGTHPSTATTHPPLRVIAPQGSEPEPSKIVLMEIDPYRVHAYWHLNPEDKGKVLTLLSRSSHQPSVVMRMYDVTSIHFDGTNAHSHFDIEVQRDQGNWYVDLWSPHKSLCAEIGLKVRHGSFYPIARSNLVETPRAYLSSPGREQWMKVTENYEAIALPPAEPSSAQIEQTNPPSPHNFKRDLPAPHPTEGTVEVSLPRTSKPPSSEKSHLTPKMESQPEDTIKQSTLQEHHPSTITEHRITEREIREYYRKLLTIDAPERWPVRITLLTGIRMKAEKQFQKETGEATPAVVVQGEETHLVVEHTHYGSDIRWEEETVRSPKKKNYSTTHN